MNIKGLYLWNTSRVAEDYSSLVASPDHNLMVQFPHEVILFDKQTQNKWRLYIENGNIKQELVA
jgi:hypothetical protein